MNDRVKWDTERKKKREGIWTSRHAPNASNPITAVTYFFLFRSTRLIVTRLAIFRFTSASSFAAAFFSFLAVSASRAVAAARESVAAFAVRASAESRHVNRTHQFMILKVSKTYPRYSIAQRDPDVLPLAMPCTW